MCLKRGIKIPAPFDDPPEISFGSELFFKAWADMSAERAISDGPTPMRITRKQIREWLEWHELDKDYELKEELLVHVNALEDAYIPIETKKRQAAAKKREAEAKRKTKRTSRRG